MVLTLVSSDKLSLSMFVNFYKCIYDRDVELLDLNSLTSADLVNSITKNFVGTHLNRASSEEMYLLIRYKTKGAIKLEKLPVSIQDLSTHIVKFDIFSTTPEVLKSRFPEKLEPILERWKANIEKMNVSL